MKRFSLKTKYLLYVGFVLLTFSIILLLFGYSARQSNMVLENILAHPAKEMNKADVLRSLLNKLVTLPFGENSRREVLIKRISRMIDGLQNKRMSGEYIFQSDSVYKKINRQWSQILELERQKSDKVKRKKIQLDIRRMMDLIGEFHRESVKNIANQISEHKLGTKKILWSIVGILIFLCAVTIILSWMIGKSVMGAIEKISHALDMFSQGKMDHRIEGPLPREFNSVSSGFNNMAGRMEQSYIELRNMSIHDDLTGALNYRQFNHDIRSEIERSSRYKHEFVVYIMDVNDFKEVNDTFGHQAGNEVLKGIVNTIRGHMRVTDNVYRIGGDEFAVILPETNGIGGQLVMKRMSDAIYEKLIRCFDDINVRTSISIGMAVYPEDAESMEALCEKADDEMYLAKNRHQESRAQESKEVCNN